MRVEIEATNMESGKTTTMVAVFNERELGVRLFEAMLELKHPDDVTWEEALAVIAERDPETHDACQRMAKAAMQYFAQQVNLAGRQPDERTQ